MRRVLLFVLPVATLLASAPAYAEGELTTNTWGYTYQPDPESYVSRGFCEAVASGSVSVELTMTCSFRNTVGQGAASVTVVSSSPTAAATLEAATDWRGLFCVQATARFVDGSVVHYPGPGAGDAECTRL